MAKTTVGMRGLHRVNRGGREYWILRIQIDGKRTDHSLGACSKVSEAEAILKAEAKRVDLLPVPAPMPAPVVYAVAEEAMSLGAAVNSYMDIWMVGKSEETVTDMRSLVERYLLPEMGHKMLHEVRRRDVLDLLVPLHMEHPDACRKTRGFLDRTYKWAMIVLDNIEYSPADVAIKAAMPAAPPVKHHASMPYRDIQWVVREVCTLGNHELRTRCGLLWLILTGTRLSESIGCGWDDIDMVDKVWTVPGFSKGRKAAPAFRVPLSKQMLDILAVLGPEKPGKSLGFSQGGMRRYCDNYLKGVTRHGFRTTIRTWAQDTDRNWAASEMVLSHKVGDAAAQAYARSDMLDIRRDIMQDWADFTGFKVRMLAKGGA